MTETVGETETVTAMETAPGPEGEPQERRYICSQCGAKVVPQRAETPSGTSNRCPECNRSIEPLAKKEV